MRRFPAVEVRKKKKTDPFYRELRKCESPIEKRLFKAIQRLNCYVVTQYSFGRYRLDMALPNLQIAIEADGKAYHSSPKQKAHDRKRDAYLKSHGWQTLRFSGSQINGDINGVIKRIEKEMEKRKAHLN
jgi:very-short-patch-repair endonuclease